MPEENSSANLRETDEFILEEDGPIRFVKVTGIPETDGEAWVPPADAFMLKQHGCVCAQWETATICTQMKDGVCIKWKTIKRCMEWHCQHND